MGIREESFQGKPINVPIIDAHTHILSDNDRGLYQAYPQIEKIILLMNKLGINCIVTAPHPIVLGMMEYANEQAALATLQYPERIYGYISICPHDGIEGVKKAIALYSKNKSFIGLKLLAGYQGELTRPEYEYALDFAEEARCPVLSHIWENSPTLESVENSIKKRGSLKLIMAHQGGGTSESTDHYVKLMNEYPNLYMDICGSLFNTYRFEEIVQMAGEDRVIYGSDLIYLDPRYDLGRIVLSTLSDTVKEKLLSKNYLNLLKDSQMGKIIL